MSEARSPIEEVFTVLGSSLAHFEVAGVGDIRRTIREGLSSVGLSEDESEVAVTAISVLALSRIALASLESDWRAEQKSVRQSIQFKITAVEAELWAAESLLESVIGDFATVINGSAADRIAGKGELIRRLYSIGVVTREVYSSLGALVHILNAEGEVFETTLAAAQLLKAAECLKDSKLRAEQLTAKLAESLHLTL